MMASRGMGAIRKGVVKKRRDNTDFTEYAKGGEAKNWIAGAVKNPGALRSQLGVKEGQNIPAGKLAKAASAPGKLGQRARLAQTLSKLGK